MTIENKQLLAIKKKLREVSPGLLSIGAALYYKIFRFKLEKAYMKGKVTSDLAEPSLILLSSNRAATQFVEEVLGKIYKHAGGEYIALNRYLFFFDRKKTILLEDYKTMSELMRSRGFFFGQQGPFAKHEVFVGYKKVVMVRDPRDLLVSHFYSFAHAHIPRNQESVAKIKKAKEMGLQKYVLLDKNVSYFKQCINQAIVLRDQKDVLFYKYEDMMSDFVVFQETCQKFITGEVSKELSVELNAMHKKPEPDKIADNSRHRRSGAWGQFKIDLEPDVIEKLTEEFKDQLLALGYPVES